MKFRNDTFCTKTNSKHYIILKYFLVITGVVPLTITTNSNFNILKWSLLIFQYLILTLCTIISISGKSLFLSTALSAHAMLTLLAVPTSIFLNIYGTSCIYLWKYKKYIRFLNCFDEIDRIVYRYILEDHRINCNYHRKMIFWKTIAPLALCLIHIIYSLSGYNIVLAVENLLRHLTAFKIILLQYHLEQIGYRYEIIQDIVVRITRKYFERNLGSNQYCDALKNVTEILIHLNELIVLFNDIFGWFLLIFTLSIILNTILYVYTALVLFNVFSLKWMSVLMFWACFYLVSMIYVVSLDEIFSNKKSPF